MLMIRLAKVLTTAMLACFAALVAYNNIVDYDTNFEFVRNVMSMSSVLPGSALMDRAMTSDVAWHFAYVLIIAAELLTALFLAFGALALLFTINARAERFNNAKGWMVVGATIGFALWFFGFMVIAGEYFAMWQSEQWNGQEAAFRFYITLIAVTVFVCQRDDDLA